jgi:hypothetical protein
VEGGKQLAASLVHLTCPQFSRLSPVFTPRELARRQILDLSPIFGPVRPFVPYPTGRVFWSFEVFLPGNWHALRIRIIDLSPIFRAFRWRSAPQIVPVLVGNFGVAAKLLVADFVRVCSPGLTAFTSNGQSSITIWGADRRSKA